MVRGIKRGDLQTYLSAVADLKRVELGLDKQPVNGGGRVEWWPEDVRVIVISQQNKEELEKMFLCFLDMADKSEKLSQAELAHIYEQNVKYRY